MYYSKQTGGFYDPVIHGPRTLTIIKPGWVPPTILVPDPQWVAEDDSDEAAPLIEIEDPDVVPPTIEVDNPECKIPADAVSITEAQWLALLQDQSQGKEIRADSKGSPIAADRIHAAPPAKETATEDRARLVDAGFTPAQASAILALLR